MANKRYQADEISVTFFAPETLQAQRIDAALADGASGDQIAEIARATGRGEFREYLGEEEVNGKIEAKLGRVVQWVDGDPDNNEGGGGFYEVYSGEPVDYVPVVTGDDARARL